ncbi:sugar ABC transporter permease [Oceanotoga sp. DSM 15011]|jgi:putative chitobiose transport system permease protein|uniref:Carbohydrate ABC transporter membrane protein 1 (CUT1 family) n=1 Tax=Oceanotoga teriensis TaxID=515440 RepID=A0AA45HHN0_9BACT|nr:MULTISPECIES: sugar ABC transporter permease [Oceanotoga]MDN5342887.1 putative chitobiose transport system permease protein [Oceanotoga sp.]MDO7976619.1 sugar ABC transporter permease [Oceanotoga teriensis]PWJ87704.1 carbohydrate ABC transporter membrane protein 1 (CUT1 family) [Oceanotoga teriensis]UYO99336.1 sugar ABC transporter permease [Oceanotoga sp. DSM 15011]
MKISRKKQTYIIAFSFLVLPLLLLAVFTYYPMIRGVVLSFSDYNMFTHKTKWVGFENYKFIFNYKYFYISLLNTLKYMIIVPFIQFFAILLALLVNQKLPGMKLFRTLFYVPVITGAVIVSLSWRWIFDVDGILNNILINFNIIDSPIAWLTNEKTAIYCAMFVTLWRGIGYYMVIYMAGLQNIPSVLYEAAAIDGATKRQQFWKITMPLLKPTMLLAFLMSTISAVKIFEEVFLLTGGKANTSTLLFEVYNLAFTEYKFGRSSALSIILSGILIIFAIINFKFFGTGVEKDAKK